MPAPRKRDSLIEKLRDLREELHYLVVYVANDDKPTEVAVPNVRQRWQRIQSVLDELAWERVEALDKKRGIIMVHVRNASDERPATELEELVGTATGRAAEISALMNVATTAILRAQEVALQRQHDGMQQVLDAQSRIIDSTIRRFEQTDKQYQEMLRVNYALHGQRFQDRERQFTEQVERALEKVGATEDESSQVLDKLLPELLKAFLDKPDKPTPKNGAPKAAPAAKAAV